MLDVFAYQGLVVYGLRKIHFSLTNAIKRCEEMARRNMREISPGLWVSNKFKDWAECKAFLDQVFEGI